MHYIIVSETCTKAARISPTTRSYLFVVSNSLRNLQSLAEVLIGFHHLLSPLIELGREELWEVTLNEPKNKHMPQRSHGDNQDNDEGYECKDILQSSSQGLQTCDFLSILSPCNHTTGLHH
jgi:hypothetical protein